MKRAKNSRTHKSILITIMGILTIYSALALPLTDNVTIRSSGIISLILPLHVEGRYFKNSLNQTVLLKGVNKPELADDPDGIWMGNTKWRDENVKAELDAMKSWGVNVIRCHFSVELWKYDIGPASEHPASFYCAISAREAIKRLLNFTAERGIYVLLDPYSVRCYWTDGAQDPLPFPPYAKSPNASDIIGSVEEFVDWWISVARELKDYPNVMFDLWNEPGGNSTAWLDAANMCISAIREEGFTGIIFFEWGSGMWANVYADEETFPLGYVGLSGCRTWYSWLDTGIGVDYVIANLSDPLGNLAFDCHFYRTGGSCGLFRGTYRDTLREYWNTTTDYPWDYDQVKMVMEAMGWKYAAEKVPIICGEIGASLGWISSNPTEHQNEMTAFGNVLSIFEEWGIGYTAFWWRNAGVFGLHNGPPSFTPTDSGEILMEILK
ncbi:MAG: cellulase family glycosylhydrolase [Candidatus Bathyarchaeia archaeon]